MTKEDLAGIKSYVLYTADALGKGMSPRDLNVSLAKMQYMADTEGPIRKPID